MKEMLSPDMGILKSKMWSWSLP